MSKKTTKRKPNSNNCSPITTPSNISLNNSKEKNHSYFNNKLYSSELNFAKFFAQALASVIPFVIDYFIPNKKWIVILAIIIASLFSISLFYGIFKSKYKKGIFVSCIILIATFISWKFLTIESEVQITSDVMIDKSKDHFVQKDTVFIKSERPTINIKNVYEQKAVEPEKRTDFLTNKISEFGASTNFLDYLNNDKYSITNYTNGLVSNPFPTTSLLDSSFIKSVAKYSWSTSINADSILHPERYSKISLDKPLWLSEDIKVGNYTPTSTLLKSITDSHLTNDYHPKIVGIYSEEIESDLKEYPYCLNITINSRDAIIGGYYYYDLTFSEDIDHFDFDELVTYHKSILGGLHSYVLSVEVIPKTLKLFSQSKVPEIHFKAYSKDKAVLIN